MTSGSPRVSGPAGPAQEAASMAATRMTAPRGTTQILETVPTEIRLKHRLVLRDLGDRALRDRSPRGEDGHAVCDPPHEPQVVLDEDDGEAALAQVRDQIGENVDLAAIRAGAGLVEQKDARLRCQSRGDHQPPLGVSWEL